MKKILEKIRAAQKDQVMILVLAGILLLVIAIPVKEEEKSEDPVQIVPPVVQASQKEQLEADLKQVLQKVSGVGAVEVMIALKSDGRRIVEKDTQISEEKQGNGSAEEPLATQQKSSSENTVYQKGADGTENPYVIETIEPEITGVIVAAQGAKDPVIVTEITEAVMALFGLEAHKIKVMKME